MSDDSRSSLLAANWPALELRAALMQRLRSFLDRRGFLEVETPCLSREVVVERHLDPLVTTLFADPHDPDRGPRYWLQTSPEAHLKRLVADASRAIYAVARVFRGGETGRRHNPEFTLVEWYRPGDTLSSGMDLLAELCEELLAKGPAARRSYAAALREFAGVDAHHANVDELTAAALARGVAIPPGMSATDRDAWLNLLLAELVEPRLGVGRPTILYDYPASQAALAKVGPPEAASDVDPATTVAKRFELYVDGVELANGYWELLDPTELARRMDHANDQRRADGKRTLPPATALVAAMKRGLPDCVGVALGFDRIVMLAAGAASVADVMAFPIDRA